MDNRERGRRPSYGDIVKSAYSSVNDNTKIETDEKKWLIQILNILSDKCFARVMADGCLIDIEAICDTHRFASFFDVYNNLHNFNTSVPPIRINELVNPISLLHKF